MSSVVESKLAHTVVAGAIFTAHPTLMSVLLGRLFDRDDLIKPVSNVRPPICTYVPSSPISHNRTTWCLRTYVRPSVRQSTKRFFDSIEIWPISRGR